MGKTATNVVRAGGGVITRLGSHGRREVLIIHRRRGSDWSFPKGKCDSIDETYKDAALREVLEETGYRCAIGDRLGVVEYVDRHGRDKRVHYWEMTVLDGVFEANDEVDRAKWVTIERAIEKLGHKRDRRLLAKLSEIEPSKTRAA